MAGKSFKGDSTHRLPEGMMNPYLLWFKALQLAYRSPDIEVNKRFYRDWGEIEEVKFDVWWKDKWRDLFAVSMGVREVVDMEDFKRSQDGSSLIVRVPIDQDWKKTSDELREIMEFTPRNVRSAKRKGKFYLQGAEKLRRYDIWRYLKSYEFHLDGHPHKEIAFRYCEWRDHWDIVRGNRPAIKPGVWEKLKDAIEQGDDIYADHPLYRSARRVIARGRKVVVNAAKGEFPGTY